MPKFHRNPTKENDYPMHACPKLSEETRRLMVQGYEECAEESRQLAEEWLPLTLEVLPEWDGPLPEPVRRRKRRRGS